VWAANARIMRFSIVVVENFILLTGLGDGNRQAILGFTFGAHIRDIRITTNNQNTKVEGDNASGTHITG